MVFPGSSTAVAFTIGAALLTGSVTLAQPAAAADRVARYCIAIGGGGEGSGYRTTRCEFFDYQACIQAAIGGGNCVQNIDYRGDTPSPATPSRRRR
jgi:hypothetical protein